MTGAYQLQHVRAPRLGIECSRCDRHGSYAVANLVAQFGADMVLPELLRRIAMQGNCPRVGDQYDACKAKFTADSIASFRYAP